MEPLLKLCWLISNEEAKRLGATEITPQHFLIGVLKVIDPVFPQLLDKMDIPSVEWAEICKSAQNIRLFLDIMPDGITRRRRALRARLDAQRTTPPITHPGMLHRSESLKKAFHDAGLFAEGDALTLRGIAQSMFELGLVSLDDIEG